MIYDRTLLQGCIEQIIQHNPVLKNIFEKIDQNGGRTLLVGGAVRDCLLHLPLADLDFEVYYLTLEQLQTVLSQFGPVDFVGKSFGVLRLHGLDADWSIPRKDSCGRKPQVDLDPHMHVIDAFARRDLTINAMSIDVKTLELIDPYHGLSDLQNKILRSPNVNFFVQDPLRLFRVMQFMARFEMQPDAALDDVCKTMPIDQVSRERIEQEFKKLFLKAKKPSLGLQWLQKIGRFQEVFPQLVCSKVSMASFDYLATAFPTKFSSDLKLAAMWALLAGNVASVISASVVLSRPATVDELGIFKQFIKKYVLDTNIIDAGAALVWYVQYVPKVVQPCEYAWLAHWLAKVCSLEALAALGSCLYDQKIIDSFVMRAQRAGVFFQAKKPLLQGKDLLFLAQGKELGDLVKKAYALQLNAGITDAAQLLQILKKSDL